MIPHKKQLKPIAPKNSSRYVLNGVKYAEEYGELWITDGRVCSYIKVNQEDFKNVESVLPLEAFDYQKKSKECIIEEVFDSENKSSKIKIVELDSNNNRIEKVIAPLEGRFPDCRNHIIPTKKPNFSIVLNASLLKSICESIEATNKGEEVFFEFIDEDSAILISPQKNKDQGFLLMPIKSDGLNSSFFNKGKLFEYKLKTNQENVFLIFNLEQGHKRSNGIYEIILTVFLDSEKENDFSFEPFQISSSFYPSKASFCGEEIFSEFLYNFMNKDNTGEDFSLFVEKYPEQYALLKKCFLREIKAENFEGYTVYKPIDYQLEEKERKEKEEEERKKTPQKISYYSDFFGNFQFPFNGSIEVYKTEFQGNYTYSIEILLKNEVDSVLLTETKESNSSPIEEPKERAFEFITSFLAKKEEELTEEQLKFKKKNLKTLFEFIADYFTSESDPLDE